MAGRWVGYAALAVGAAAAGAAVTLALSGGTRTVTGGLAPASTSVASPLPGSTTGPPPSCPPVSASAPAWPVAALAGLPTVPGAVISSVQRQSGTLAVQFGVPASFLTLAAQLRAELPPRGYALFGGDQEAREADIRFISGSLTGGFKLVDAGGCYSRVILAVVDPGAAPSAAPSG